MSISENGLNGGEMQVLNPITKGAMTFPAGGEIDPEKILEQAVRASQALKKVIALKEKPVIFNGEQYLELEDWQTVGRFYSATVRTLYSRPVEFGNVKGWEARAEVVDVYTGAVLSCADAMCLDDEEKWRARPKYEYVYVCKDGTRSKEEPHRNQMIWEPNPNKPGKNRPKKERILVGEEKVPFFQLRSMAQTRACSKALRNVFAWVVVLAGYKTTPAEEIQDMIPREDKNNQEDDGQWPEEKMQSQPPKNGNSEPPPWAETAFPEDFKKGKSTQPSTPTSDMMPKEKKHTQAVNGTKPTITQPDPPLTPHQPSGQATDPIPADNPQDKEPITAELAREVTGLWNKTEISKEDFKKEVSERFKKDSILNLTCGEAKAMIQWLNTKPRKKPNGK